MPRRSIRVIGVLALLCCGCVSKTYIAADRATYEAIAPAYAEYVKADANLTLEQIGRRLRTLEAWLKRIEAAEKN